VELLESTVVLFWTFWVASTLFSIVVVPICSPTVNESSFSPHFCQRLLSLIFMMAILIGVRWYLTVILVLSIFSCICWPFWCLLWIKVYFVLSSFKTGLFVSFFILSLGCVNSLCILDFNPLSDIWLTKRYSPYLGCHFILLIFSFAVQNFLLSLISSCLLIFAFVACGLGVMSRKFLCRVWDSSPVSLFCMCFSSFPIMLTCYISMACLSNLRKLNWYIKKNNFIYYLFT